MLQAAVVLESGVGEPSLDGVDDREMTSEALVSRIEERQAARQPVSNRVDDGGVAGFEPTETAFFD